nr:MAG: hypothetical protein [Lake Baikal virophage 8]
MSGSYYALNSKINNLQAEINAITPVPPLPPTANIVTTNTAQTITGLKTFSVLPKSSVVPSAGNDLVNKTYADGLVSTIPTLQQVLDAGSLANDDSITLQSTSLPSNLILSPTSIDISETAGSTIFQNRQTKSDILVKTINGITGDFTETKIDANTGLSVELFNGTLGAVQTSSVLGTNSLTMSNGLGGVFDSEILIENPNSFSEVRATFDDIGSGITAVGSVKSQSGQSDYSTSVSDGTGNVGIKTLITGAGVVLDTNIATDGTILATSVDNVLLSGLTQAISFQNGGIQNFSQTQATSTLADTTLKYLDGSFDIECKSIAQSGQASVISSAKNLSTTVNASSTDFISSLGAVGNLTYNSDDTFAPITVSNYGYQINATNALGGFTYNDNTPSANITNSVGTTTTASTASHTLTSSSASGGSIHSLKLETPVSGNALIAHTVTAGASRNLNLTTTGDFLITSDNLTATSSNLGITSSTTGYTSSPALTITNTNTSGGNTNGVPSIETYKSGRIAVASDVIYSQAYFANNYLGTKTEFAKIESSVRNTGAGNDDGSIAFSGLINGVQTEFFRVNGADSENNMFLPLDMNGQAIKSSSGNLNMDTSSSSGTGQITLTPKSGQSVLIRSVADTTNDFIRINPQVSANNQQVLMTATDTGTGFINSINLLNLTNRPFIELKADFGGAINKSIQLDANGAGSSNNRITAYDGQTNLPFQIDASTYTNGSIELKVQDTTGDLVLTSTNIQSSTAGGNSGQHLRIKLNGVYYKIKLEDD